MKFLIKFLSALNFLNTLSSKCPNKLSSKLILATLTIACSQFIVINKLDAKIPEYKGLYTLFTKETDSKPATDTIGIGQSLKWSNWLENVYTYAPEDNATRKVIAILWDKRLLEGPDGAQVFTETNNFIIRENHPAKFITPQDLGKIIKYIREFKKDGDYEKRRAEFLAAPKQGQTGLSKDLRGNGKKDKASLEQFIIVLEELKCDTDNFIPEMAESILWAFFDSKNDWGEDEFKACLSMVDPSLLTKLQGKYEPLDFYYLDKYFVKKENIETQVINIATKPNNPQKNYDNFTYYLIKSSKTKKCPTKVEQTNLKCKHPITGKESKNKFPTCFESSILDIFSILIYDSKNKKYDQEILPEAIKKSENFKNLIEQVFKFFPESTTLPENATLSENGQSEGSALPEENIYTKDKEFILAENINKRMQTWANLISNSPDTLKYKNNNDTGSYDLNPSFENLVKVLNKFLGLGFEIIDTKDTLEATLNNSEKITVEKDKLESWQALFDIISKKLSTVERPVKLRIETIKIENEIFRKIEKKDVEPFHVGAINISVGENNFHIIIKYFDPQEIGHAYIIFPERDTSLLLTKNLKDLKNAIICDKAVDKNNNMIPIFIFLPYIQIIESEPKIDNLHYYSFQLKNIDIKIAFLNEISDNASTFYDGNPENIKKIYENESIRKLISKIIEILPENDLIIAISMVSIFKDLLDKPYWKSELENKITKIINFTISEANFNTLINIVRLIYSQQPNEILSQALKHPLASFYFALRKNDIKQIEKIVNNPEIDINFCYGLYGTFLNFACSEYEHFYSNVIEIIKTLLANPKINVNSLNSGGSTPLICLAEHISKYDSVEVVKILLEHPEIDVNAFAGSSGYSALLIAYREKKLELVQLLLNHKKININAKDKNGQTNLYNASLKGRTEIVQSLLALKNIDIYAKNKDLKTAKDIAKENGHKEIVKLFEEYELKKALEESKPETISFNPSVKKIEPDNTETSQTDEKDIEKTQLKSNRLDVLEPSEDFNKQEKQKILFENLELQTTQNEQKQSSRVKNKHNAFETFKTLFSCSLCKNRKIKEL